jgi:phytoene dehydrogenase-like protein
MPDYYDVIVIGAGLGGLTAAARLAQAGRKTLLVERNYGVGGAASTYKSGDLVVEASLHETSNPKDPNDPKHYVLAGLGVLDKVEWVPTPAIYEVRGGPVGKPFVLPEGFAKAQASLIDRFPSARAGIASVLGEIASIATSLGTLSRGREAFRNPVEGLSALSKLGPMIRGWRLSVAERFDRAFGENEAVKCALAANLAYWHDDPETLWWVLFAVAQGGYIGSGGCYVRGGSQRLSHALFKAFKTAGGDILLRRRATKILIDQNQRPSGIIHEGGEGGDPVEAWAPIVVSNAAPAVVAEMLPSPARYRFIAPYGGRRPSISLFSATFGLSARPAEVGFTNYSTLLLPTWMKRLSDYSRCEKFLGAMPDGDAPPLTIVDYSAIDSGLGGPPFAISVVGVDRLLNWSGLSTADYNAKRDRWREALVEIIDREFPGFATKVTSCVFNTASSMSNYLNAPEGAVYGFAPLPPSSPIWKGPNRSPKTAISDLFLASSYAGSGGFTGAILAGAAAAELIIRGRGAETRST